LLQGLAALCPGIASCASLLRLNLENKGLTAVGCVSLAEALTANSTLQELILTRNNLGQQGLAALGSALVSLKFISLAECGLSGTDSGTVVSNLLINSSNLQVLRLEENAALDTACITALSPGLGTTRSLIELHLRGCPLQAQGISTLFQNLPISLKHIDISGTNAGPEGLIAAAAALGSDRHGGAPNLTRLVACGCGGDDASLAALVDSLSGTQQVDSLKGIEIDFSGNSAGKLTIAALARCRRLHAICLHDCKLGSEGADALYAQILDNENSNQFDFVNLLELDISANGLETPQLVNILEALSTTTAGAVKTCCPGLKQLVIAVNPGAMESEVTAAIEKVQAVREELDVVRRSADTGERDGQNNN
jgi:Ran GTPase-activating protein (RanGAP) involved in mRNA processing and transport